MASQRASSETSSSTPAVNGSVQATQLVDDTGLHPLKARPSIPAYISALRSRKGFIKAQVRSNALHKSRDLYLGKLWLLLDPLFQVLIYVLIFGIVLKISRDIDNYIGYLVIGVIFFSFFSRSMSSATTVISSSKSLISSFKFPRASIPISAVLRQVVDNLPAAVIAIVIALLAQHDEPLHWTLVFVPLIYVMLHAFIMATTFIVARVCAFIPDFKSIVTLLTRALFFTSGVFFSVERFDSNPLLADIMTFNPVYQFLLATRNAALYGIAPLNELLYLTAWTVILLVLGFVFFWRAEERYDDA